MDEREVAGIRWAIDWLHKRAARMDDPHATDVLNSAATNMGWMLRKRQASSVVRAALQRGFANRIATDANEEREG